MNTDSEHIAKMEDPDDVSPILIVPYMWIGDFVRGHTVVRVLKQRWPNRPIDLLVTSLCAPLVDYMPGVRSSIVWDLPRNRLAVARQWGLAGQVGARNYGTGRIRRRGEVRADQQMALGRKGPAPFHRQERRAGAARWGPVAP